MAFSRLPWPTLLQEHTSLPYHRIGLLAGAQKLQPLFGKFYAIRDQVAELQEFVFIPDQDCTYQFVTVYNAFLVISFRLVDKHNLLIRSIVGRNFRDADTAANAGLPF